MSYLARGLAVASYLFLLICATSSQAAQLSESDVRLYRGALAAAQAGDGSGARRDGERAHDPVLLPMLRWLSLMKGDSGAHFADYTEFLTSHPDWPGQKTLGRHAEDKIGGVADATLVAWFAKHPPVTLGAKLREAEILAAQGKNAESVERIRQIWVTSDLAVFDEKSLLQRYHGLLRSADHVARLDRLLWDGQTDQVRRMLPLVDPGHRALAAARLSLAALGSGADRLVARVPAELQQDPGLLYERVRWRRRKDREEEAIAILQGITKDPVRPAAWAAERQSLARYALGKGQYPVAYKLASLHRLTEGTIFAELEFLAGWTALRHLHRPDTAYNHFVRLYEGVKLPISVARGAYWSARAAEQMGHRDLARTWYGTASGQPTTYYGQLATTQLGLPNAVHEPQPKPDEIAAFNRSSLVTVTRALAQLGDDDHLRQFMRQISVTAQTPAAHALTAKLALELGRPDLAIAAAKRASYAGVTLLAEGYPITDLPQGGSVERPLILAMTRQESAFDREAVSSAGARGMMQLMPATASIVAKSLNLPFSMARLTGDVHYNITLGRAYLDGLLGNFSGSYVLAIASYNAGPARVKQWLHNFGDPRAKGADVIDWIEAIPISETRNYVQRVLENLQVYRLRVGDHGLAFSLASDLRR